MEIKREVIMDVLQNKTVEEIADYFEISAEKASEMKAHNERNYWEISYKDLIGLMHWGESNNWMTIRKRFGDACFKTFSDRGGVLVGNDTFQTLVRNGRGDGITRVAVLSPKDWDDWKKWNQLMEESDVYLDGKFHIYQYDCSTETSIRELNGRYMTYYYDGLVLFLELEKYE